MISGLLKIISKVLEARLRKVIGKLISNNQEAFVPGRQILDRVLVINKILYFAKRNKKECMVFKVDFSQAYDCFDWNYLRLMLRRMGFGDRWMKWIEVAVFTSSMSILVDGSPTADFQVSR